MRVNSVRWGRVCWALSGGALIGALALAGAASAHVTVDPSAATQGGYERIAFRVPTESDTASTIKIDVFLDMAHPIASVSTMPVPGWSVKVTTSKLATPLTNDDGDQVTEAVSEIVWTADSAATAIKPGEFDEFPVSLGPLPAVPTLVFKVLQTYSDKSIVRWIDQTPAGGPEPEHPAPVLTLATAGAEPRPTADSPTVASSAGTIATVSGSGGSNSGAMTLAIIGALLGLVGAVLGGAAYARTRGAATIASTGGPTVASTGGPTVASTGSTSVEDSLAP